MTNHLTDEAVKALLAEQTISPNPYDDCAHFDDHAVNSFAVVMKGKLAAKRLQGRGGWQEPDVENGYLSRLLREHVDKGDPVDVANLAMMIHQRGERIGPENEGATCGAIERAEAERDRLAAELAQARADAQAAVAVVVEQAARDARDVFSDHKRAKESVDYMEQLIYSALAPADGLAALEALRADRVKGQKDYCALMERHDAIVVELAAAKQREARRSFPILKGDGAKIDYQLVSDHAEQARSNHGQSVDQLASRGGLSWCELYAVLHNRKWEKIDNNEAMIACRALEARYLAALASRPDGGEAPEIGKVKP
jgi:hypothetical protein